MRLIEPDGRGLGIRVRMGSGDTELAIEPHRKYWVRVDRVVARLGRDSGLYVLTGRAGSRAVEPEEYDVTLGFVVVREAATFLHPSDVYLEQPSWIDLRGDATRTPYEDVAPCTGCVPKHSWWRRLLL